MDDPSLPAADHDAALDGLARLNAWSFADRPFRDGIKRLLPRDEQPISILDLAADIVTCSLFLHHLQEDAVTAVLRNLHACARLGGVVCDLRRSGTGLVLAAAASRLATRSHVVHFDAVTSVRAAFNEVELKKLAIDAGITAPRMERAFPQRMRLSWRRREDASK